MNLNKKPKYETAPAGSHIARCYQVVDLGMQEHVSKQTGDRWMQRDVRITWELPLEQMKDGRPFSVSGKYKQSFYGSSKLLALLEGWRGKKFDKDSLDNFDASKLVGQPCRITVVHNGDYANVVSASPLGKGETCPPQINEGVCFSLEEAEFSPSTLAKLPEKMQEEIKASPTYKELMQESGAEPEQAADRSKHFPRPASIP